MSPRIAVVTAVVLLVAGVAAPASAQEKPTYLLTKKQTDEAKKADPKCEEQAPPKPAGPPSPWTFALRFGSVFQLSSNRSVVGALDGTSRSFSADVHGRADWVRSRHEVRNRLDVAAVFIKTPNTRRWVPARDVVELETIYQYRSIPYLGPFARAGLATSLFVGRDLRTNTVRYQLPDGSLSEETTEARLTDPFVPLTLLESVGVFVNPARRRYFDLDVRAGAGFRQVFADGQLGVKDDSDTPGVVELVELQSYQQAGMELIGMIRGVTLDGDLSYYSGGEFLLPILRTEEPGDDRGAFELLEKTFRFGIAYKLAKFATALYELRIVHQPQLIDVYQIQNTVGLKASYSVF